jgi:branched-chain amino acid aminotransferase
LFVDFQGNLVGADAAQVSVFDGGFLHGDGLFETVRCYRGQPFALHEHIERLARSATLLQIPCSDAPEHWLRRIRALLEKNGQPAADCVIRIQLSRGGDAQTDLIDVDPASLQPVSWIQWRPLPADLPRWQRDGVRVLSLQASFARGNFPQLKSLNYLPAIMALRFARGSGYDEACLLNRQGKLLEGATSNVFLVHGGRLRTPSPRLGILAGLARARVMRLASELGLIVEEVASELRDVLVSDEVFLTSSVKEILPVIAVDNAQIGDSRPGPITRQLQQAYRAQVDRFTRT